MSVQLTSHEKALLGSPRRENSNSFLGFLRNVRGADPRCPGGRQNACRKALEKDYKTERVTQVTKAALSTLSGPLGGYVIPPQFSAELLRVLSEESFIYPRATILEMDGMELTVPKFDAETAPTTVGVSPFFGSVQFRWGAERFPAEIAEPQFRMDAFHAWDLLGYAVVSNQWMEDSGVGSGASSVRTTPLPASATSTMASTADKDSFLIKLFGKAAAWTFEYAMLNGTGAAFNMPLGILNAPGRLTVARATNGQIVNTDIATMTSKLLPRSWNSAVWACSPTALAQIQTIPQYFLNFERGNYMGKMKPKPAGAISCLPLFVTDKLNPTTATGKLGGDLILFDPELITIAMRQDVVVDVSEHTLFQTAQTVFRIWMRADSKPELQTTVTLPDTQTVCSAYVVLDHH